MNEMVRFAVATHRVKMTVRKWCGQFHVSAQFKKQDPFCVGIYDDETLALEVAWRWANREVD